MKDKRKGITPVIAIVLLLLITVGAVGVVYTQFRGLVQSGEAQKQLNQQQRVQRSSYSIIAVQKVGSSPGSYEVNIKNTGNNAINLSKEGVLKIGKDGSKPRAITTYPNGRSLLQCGITTLDPGATKACDTGVDWGTTADGQATTIELQVGNAIKATTTCLESPSGCKG